MSFMAFEPWSSEEPGVYDFVVRVPKAVLRGDKVLVPGKTTYKTFPYAQRARCNEAWCQDYVFVLDTDGGPTNEGDGGLLHEFWFTKNRRGAVMRTPIASRTMKGSMPHPWPTVIQRMGFIEDPTQPLTLEVGGAVVEVPRLFGRYWKLPGGVYASKFKQEVYLSPVTFPDNFILLDVPVPTVVTWNIRNEQGSVECLHPRIRFKETQTGGRVLPDSGTVENPIIMEGVQDFPATNHVTWLEHVCDEVPSQVRGVHRMVRTTVQIPGIKRIRNSA